MLPGTRFLGARSPDGSFNDLADPLMGSAGTRFGRNVHARWTAPESPERLMRPNPRRVSQELLARDTFKPAATLNLLAAAWLQFQVHDWLSHGRNEKDDPLLVPLSDDDEWPERPMRVLRTRRDPTQSPDAWPPTYQNTATAWWDGSQIYGSGADMLARLRTGERGRLKVAANGLLPVDDKGIDLTGVNGNWWIGLSLMHTLFTLEHNTICDQFAAAYPAWSDDDDVFDHARLVNAALMAKIHTLEWTPALIAHPTTRLAMRVNWQTIIGSRPQHHGVPYSVTEEFVAVYRMHPLLPDEVTFRAFDSGQVVRELSLPDVAFEKSHPLLEELGLTDALFSCGRQVAGALTLHNFPRTLLRLTDMEGNLNDLAAIDLLRCRERGVPRYNDFRALFHRPRLTRFEQLTSRADWAAQLREVYEGDIDSVDLMVGLYAEPLPPGFGFSDTAFRVFILMASRRLQSDRFFTSDYRPAIYTRLGLDWVSRQTFSSVVARHAPRLAPMVERLANPFAPWPAREAA